MNCRHCQALLSPLRDGDLVGSEAAEVTSHVGSCAGCGRVRDELDRMVAAAASLASPAPPDALWARIEARLDPPVRRPSGLRALLTMPRLRWLVPSLAAVSLAAVVAGLAARALRPPAPSDDVLLRDAQAQFGQAEEHYLQAIADLRVIAARERDRWPEARRAAYDQSLAALDRTLLQHRDLAHARPADPDAQEQLFGSYRREIALFQESLLRSAAVDP
ncbi:MAG: zf-HC2 domain-containing protein [Myxococcales bacterium]|nr:zf-HC2 domain-containing protein [Myxococcales bacterium]